MRRGELLDFYHGQFRERLQSLYFSNRCARQISALALVTILRRVKLDVPSQ